MEEETLNAFESLAESLNKTCSQRASESGDKQMMLRELIRSRAALGNTKHQWLLEELVEVDKETSYLSLYIKAIEEDLKKMAGYDPETGKLKDRRNFDESEELMMGENPSANEGSGNGEARVLRKKLETYEEKSRQRMTKYEYPDLLELVEPLVVQPKDDPWTVENQPERAKLSWEEDQFYDKPVVAQLATLAQLKLRVLDMEADQLNMISMILGCDLTAYQYPLELGTPVSELETPVKEREVAGMKFETRIYQAKDAPLADSGETYSTIMIKGGDTLVMIQRISEIEEEE